MRARGSNPIVCDTQRRREEVRLHLIRTQADYAARPSLSTVDPASLQLPRIVIVIQSGALDREPNHSAGGHLALCLEMAALFRGRVSRSNWLLLARPFVKF